MDVVERLRRINSALTRCRVPATQWPVRFVQTPKMRFMEANFGGGASPDQLLNDAWSLIANIASLADHLRKWARVNGRDPRKVDETIRASRDLQVVIDLWNRDKHGGDPRNGGKSGLNPRLDGVERALQMRTQAKKGSSVMVQQGRDGRLHSYGDGTASIDTSGTVYGAQGKKLGDLQDIAAAAIKAWEALLVTYEVGRGISMN